MHSGAAEQVGWSHSAMEDSTAASTLPNVATRDEQQVASHPAVAVTNPGTVLYGECQKNHEAGTGGHATDGCEGFLPRWGDDAAIKCARCSCHRSFHRREVEPGNMLVPSAYIPVLPLAWRAPADSFHQASPPLPHPDLPVAADADAASACPSTPALLSLRFPPAA